MPRHFDEGLLKHLQNITIGTRKDEDGKDVSAYLWTVAGVTGDIWITFNNPNSRLLQERIPYMDIQVEYPEESVERLQGPVVYDEQFDPETQENIARLIPTPYDIRYTLNCYLRKRSEYNAVLHQFLKRFKRLSTIAVYDSEGNRNVYPFKAEGGSDITNVIDSAERYPAVSITVKVEGEIDTTDEVRFQTVGPNGETTQAYQPQPFSEICYRNALLVQKNTDGSIRVDANNDPIFLETEIVYFNPNVPREAGDSLLATVEVFVVEVDTMGEPIRDVNNDIVYSALEILVVRNPTIPKVTEAGIINAETLTANNCSSDGTKVLDENNNVIQKDFDIMLLDPNENGSWIEETTTIISSTVSMGVCINLDIKED